MVGRELSICGGERSTFGWDLSIFGWDLGVDLSIAGWDLSIFGWDLSFFAVCTLSRCSGKSRGKCSVPAPLEASSRRRRWEATTAVLLPARAPGVSPQAVILLVLL